MQHLARVSSRGCLGRVVNRALHCPSLSHFDRAHEPISVLAKAQIHSESQKLGNRRSLAIITGGNRGLGFQIAKQLCLLPDPSLGHGRHCQGHDVLLVGGRNPGHVQQAVTTLLQLHQQQGRATGAVNVQGHAADLGVVQHLEAVLAKMTSGAGQGGWLPLPLEDYVSVLLVHNAGTTGELLYTWDQTLDNLTREMHVNVISPAAITAAVVRTFKQSPHCLELLCVNISSVSATQPYEAFGAYSAGKAARLMLAKTLAREADLLHNPKASSAAAARRAPQPVSATAPAHHSTRHGVGIEDLRSDGGTSGTCGNTTSNSSSENSQDSLGSDGSGGPPVILSMSYAPGALDTEMQAAARQALPLDAPLKAAFEYNAKYGRLTDPALSAELLLDLLSGDRSEWENGAHLSVYDLLAKKGGPPAHPLDYNAVK